MTHQNPIFVPGPTNIPDRLRDAMNVVTHDHRAIDFNRHLDPLFSKLKTIFRNSAGRVITFPSSGTGGWEAAIVNVLNPGDRILAVDAGMFSHRWIDMCRRHGLKVDVIDRPWGTGAPANTIGEKLDADRAHEFKAVLVVHNETATGVTSDIGAVRKAMDDASHPALLFVDGVSSIASLDFRMDEWKVDIAVSGSQKGFMLATGLAVVGVSEKALAACKNAGLPRCFFDFGDMIAANDAGTYPYTPNVPLLFGLNESTDMLLEEGLDQVATRHNRIAEGIRKAVSAWNLSLCARNRSEYSDTVTAISVPDGKDARELLDHIYRKYSVSFGSGLGQFSGTAFRIGHLGMLSDVLALSGLATVEMGMRDLDYPIEPGSGVAAALEHYRTP